MYKLEFFVRKTGIDIYVADYKFYQNANLLEARTYNYKQRTPIKHFNDAVNRIRGIISLYLGRKYGLKGRDIEVICTNPESDFLTRSEMARRYWAERFGEEYQEVAKTETKVLVSEPEKIESAAPQISKERLYEVVEVGGVWTIKKHDSPWYTAEEAKTQLFAKVVNGE